MTQVIPFARMTRSMTGPKIKPIIRGSISGSIPFNSSVKKKRVAKNPNHKTERKIMDLFKIGFMTLLYVLDNPPSEDFLQG